MGTDGFPEAQAHSESCEEAKTQGRQHWEGERVSLKIAGGCVLVHRVTRTRLETPAPSPRWGQCPLGHVLSTVIVFLFLQSCAKVTSHEGGS